MGKDSSTSLKLPDKLEFEAPQAHNPVPGINPGQDVASVGPVSPIATSTQEMQEMEYRLVKPLDTVSDVSEWESDVASLASGEFEQHSSGKGLVLQQKVYHKNAKLWNKLYSAERRF